MLAVRTAAVVLGVLNISITGDRSKQDLRHTHKNLYAYPFLLTIFGPIYYGPPYYCCTVSTAVSFDVSI